MIDAAYYVNAFYDGNWVLLQVYSEKYNKLCKK